MDTPNATVSDSDQETVSNHASKAHPAAEIKLAQKKKWFLLLVFSIAQYLDVVSYAGCFVFTDAIAADLGIKYATSTWIITAYSVTFASFLLFWGRVADLYSAKPVFTWGFFFLGITNLIISFLPNQYAYFVFRALSGIAGAATIPSAFRLILAIFEPEELNVALACFGMSGAFGVFTGMIIAGIFGFITAGGQLAAWRWVFRFVCFVSVPFALYSQFAVPMTSGAYAKQVTTRKDMLKRMDFPGCFMMLISIILLILGLTLGASQGFRTAGFLVPFLLCWPIVVGFFFYETRLPEGYALIPLSTWRLPNMKILIFIPFVIYPWWMVAQLPLIERSISLFHEKPIVAALRVLPVGISALITAVVVPIPCQGKLEEGDE